MPDQDIDGDGQADMYDRDEDYEEEKQFTPEDQIKMMMVQIEEMVRDSDQLWTDPEFPANDNSLYMNPLQPPDYADDTPNVEWKRPHEIYTGEGKPMMMKEGLTPGDVKQGALGDCWLLGSFLCLATNPEMLANLIVHDGIEFGYAVFQFFKNGRWQYVIVDTQIPYNQNQKSPLYGMCSDPQEFWVPLIEKAYAKLHKNYEKLNGGKMSEGMVDLTGGVSEKFNLTTDQNIAKLDDGSFWKMMKSYLKQGFLIGIAWSKKDENGEQEEGNGQLGILYNHAYGLLRMEDVTITEHL